MLCINLLTLTYLILKWLRFIASSQRRGLGLQMKESGYELGTSLAVEQECGYLPSMMKGLLLLLV
ncbi:hypothetical protein KP509_21G029200 [Ceratopteris richardii]|uniref:Uncharacterized protein n=1 Tax=Ceratopteris richardii TaxID=49495 RepID=A0A8T2SAD2_CERRI|nr:hypothetical protein KP509_21G029200 [Ceratopteris richardii]